MKTKINLIVCTTLLGLLCFSFSASANSNCSLAMDSTLHKNLVNKVNAHDFDDAKINTITSAIEKNCFTTNQVIELLKLLSFEEDKIKIAKIAYMKVIDPANWDLLYDVFEFETSKKEVKDFIAGSK